jgi:hypothetical protein
MVSPEILIFKFAIRDYSPAFPTGIQNFSRHRLVCSRQADPWSRLIEDVQPEAAGVYNKEKETAVMRGGKDGKENGW